MVDIHGIGPKNVKSTKGRGVVIDVVDRIVRDHYGVSGSSGEAATINGIAREVCRPCSSAWAVDSIGVEFKAWVSPIIVNGVERRNR